jgi:hypothetical protein
MEESTKAILDENGIILGMGKSALEKLRGKGNLPNPADGVIEKGKEVVGEGVNRIFDIFGRPVPKEE